MTRSDQARLLQRKAAQDLAVLDRLLDDAAIDDETLGYHAQQAAEKLIKALLALHGHDYPRSHNIGTTTCLWTTRRIAAAGRRCSMRSTPLWKRQSSRGRGSGPRSDSLAQGSGRAESRRSTAASTS